MLISQGGVSTYNRISETVMCTDMLNRITQSGLVNQRVSTYVDNFETFSIDTMFQLLFVKLCPLKDQTDYISLTGGVCWFKMTFLFLWLLIA